MDYEQKYKEVLEWMQKVYPSLEGCMKENAEHYFHELKESRDEEIRKAIMACCSDHGHKYQYTGITTQDMMCWLEKQGKQNTLNPDKVIEWLKTEWEDLGINWVRGVYADEIIDQFKKAMEL